MECSVYYDLASDSSFYWKLPTLGLVFGLFGAMMYMAAGLFRKSLLRFAFRLGALVFSLVWIGLSLFLSFRAHIDHQNLTNSIAHGDVQSVEGMVTKLVPAPQFGNRIENFTVDAKQFSYSANDIGPGFRQTVADGSPLRDGIMVRVRYVGEKIVKLEICE
jgi:hypothetical protein